VLASDAITEFNACVDELQAILELLEAEGPDEGSDRERQGILGLYSGNKKAGTKHPDKSGCFCKSRTPSIVLESGQTNS